LVKLIIDYDMPLSLIKIHSTPLIAMGCYNNGHPGTTDHA